MDAKDIQISGNRGYSTTMMLVGVAMILVALFILSLPQENVGDSQTPNVYIQEVLQHVGYWPMGLLLASLGIYLIVYHLMALLVVGPLLTISDQGIGYHRFGARPLPWRSLEAAALDEPILGLALTERVRLQMDDANAILDQQPGVHRVLRKLMRPYDKGKFIIHTGELSISAGELELIIRRRLRG
jgi:hypothetical protein